MQIKETLGLGCAESRKLKKLGKRKAFLFGLSSQIGSLTMKWCLLLGLRERIYFFGPECPRLSVPLIQKKQTLGKDFQVPDQCWSFIFLRGRIFYLVGQ